MVDTNAIMTACPGNTAANQATHFAPLVGDVPNVYVSVLLVKGRTSTDAGTDDGDPGQPGFRVGYTQLTVDDSSKRLQVEVKADRQEYRPRQEVAVSVQVADPQGRPRASEVTLWAMDYGLLSLTDYKKAAGWAALSQNYFDRGRNYSASPSASLAAGLAS